MTQPYNTVRWSGSCTTEAATPTAAGTTPSGGRWSGSCTAAGGVAGTLLGGRIADRIGAVRTVQLGTAVTLPALAGLLLIPAGLRRCRSRWPSASR